MHVVKPLAVAGTALLCAGPVFAEGQSPWFVRLGAAHIGFDESADVTVGGALVPGGNATVKDNRGIALEGGYFFSPTLSVSLAGGLPLTTTLKGAGSLASAGVLGDVKYGPAVLSGRYHFDTDSRWRPYLGAGVSYALIFSSEDRLLKNFDVDAAWGPALVAGVDYAVDDHWGAYLDVKKVWLDTDAHFDLPTPGGPAPGSARVTLNPLIVSAGVSYRF